MSPTSQPRPLSATMLLVAALLACSVLSPPFCVLAKMEVKGERDYKSVKEDFLCRACVGLGEVFFDEVLAPMAHRYRSTAASTGGSSSPPSSTKVASPQPRAAQPSRRQREQMIVEVHDEIDALCGTLERHIQQLSREALSVAPDDAVGQQLLSPFVTSTDIRDGVLTACPMALEEINEALTSAAFQHLLPSEKSSSTNTNPKESHADTHAESKQNVYELPAAGTFCESVGLCSSFVHYHITSDAAVRRLAREAHEAAQGSANGVDAAIRLDDAKESSGASPSKAARGKASAARKSTKNKKKTTKATAASSHYDVKGEEDESLGQTVRRVFQLSTWQRLKDSLNTTEVLSLAYWVDGARLLVDPDVLFHLQAYVPLVSMYALCLAVLLVVVLVVVFACPRKPRTARVDASSQSSERKKKQQ